MQILLVIQNIVQLYSTIKNSERYYLFCAGFGSNVDIWSGQFPRRHQAHAGTLSISENFLENYLEVWNARHGPGKRPKTSNKMYSL